MPATLLLQRYLSGGATPEEAAMIDTWIQAAEEHKALFNRVWQLWQQTSLNKGYMPPDVQQEWNELVQKIQLTIPHNRFAYRRSVIAGAILIAVIAVLLMLLPRTSNKQPAYTIHQSNNDIARDTLFGNITATLDTHSNIQYSSTAGKENTISLQAGGLYLQAPAGITTPYSVQAGGVSIQPGKSSVFIQHDTITAVSTIQAGTGSVTVKTGSGTIVLQEGEAIDWNNRQLAFGKKYAADVNSYSYATRIFFFNDTPLKDAIRYLEKAYHLSIRVKTPIISNCLITTRFDDKSIDYIMDIMSATLHFDYDYQRANNTIYLSGNGCQ